MPITGIGGSKEFPRIGVIRKGAPKTDKGYVGKDLGKFFRVVFDDRETETRERFIAAYDSLNPEEIDIIFTVDTPEEGNTWRYWLEAYDRGAMVLQTDGEWIRYLRDRASGLAVVRNGRHVDTGERVEYDGDPAYSYINKKGSRVEVFPTPHGYLRVLVPVLRRLAYLELRTTSLYDCDNISKNLAAIAGIHGSLKGIPCVLRRQPIMVSKPIGNGKRIRDETWLVFIEAAPAWVDDKLTQLEAGAFSTPPMLENGEGSDYHRDVDPQTGEIVTADAEIEEGQIVAEDEPPPEPAPEPKQPQTKAAPAVVAPHTDYPENPDIEALSLGDGSFQDAVIAEMPHYKHRNHIASALTKELGQGWGQRYSRTHLWEVLKARTETEMELEEASDE